MHTSQNKPLHIALIAFNGMSLFHLSIPLVVFAEDRQRLGVPAFKVSICSIEDNILETTSNLRMIVNGGLEILKTADIIIVPTWHSHCEQVPDNLTEALQIAYQQGKLLVGLCLGTFVLAEAGVLTGKTVSTHWYWAELFKKRYPQIKLNADVLYIDEGQIITSAGTAAALDCCLHLLRRLCGVKIANRVAKYLVIAPHRQGGQVQFIEQLLPVTDSSHRLSTLLVWLSEHLDEVHTTDSLAKQALMSRRTFTRHFKQLTGYSVTQWLIEKRINKAQGLLENTKLAVEQIALQTGFNSSLVLRQHFIKRFNLSPNQYRKSFNNS